MTDTARKCACKSCRWRGLNTEMLSAPNPFIEGDLLYACPGCRGIETVFVACDEPDCWKEATFGTPTKSGYRQTCGDHAPKVEL